MGAVGVSRPETGEASFTAFDDHYRRRVRGLLERYVPCADRAEDLTQETLVRAYGHRIHEQDADPWPWLARVARNFATDEARRKRRSDVRYEPENDRREAPEAHADYLAGQRGAAIGQVLDNLPNGVRGLLGDRYVTGLSYHQMATARSTTIASIRSGLFRARLTFAERFREVAERDGLWAIGPAMLGPFVHRLRALRARLGSPRMPHQQLSGGLAGAASQVVAAAAVVSMVAAPLGGTSGRELTVGRHWARLPAEDTGAVFLWPARSQTVPGSAAVDSASGDEPHARAPVSPPGRRLSFDTEADAPGAPGRPADAWAGIVLPDVSDTWDFQADGGVTLRRNDERERDEERSGSFTIEADCTEPGDARPLAEAACPLMPGD